MVKSTIIARVADGLPLAASMDDEDSVDLQEYKNQAKQIFKKISQETDQRCSIESGPYVFHYMMDSGVCYLTLCDRSYPRNLAYSYLEELKIEFSEKFGQEVGTVARPYAFVKFDSFIQKVKKQYKDSRSQRGVNRLNDELQDVTRIMTKNIQDVLGRGEALNRMSDMSSKLVDSSKKYRKDAEALKWKALYQKYAPIVFVIAVILLVLYLRFRWW